MRWGFGWCEILRNILSLPVPGTQLLKPLEFLEWYECLLLLTGNHRAHTGVGAKTSDLECALEISERGLLTRKAK